jgi:DNA-binding transcriptional LysR family regulator
MIAELEASLGTTLVPRTTRAVTLTEAGTNYLARIEPILSTLEEANYSVSDTAELRGTVRVGVASVTASRIIVPRSHRFMRTHPKLHLALQASRSAKRHVHGPSTSGEPSTIKSDGQLLKRLSDDDLPETTHTFPR